jgi:steroid delta-isomerase-like uncharacterized protein
LEVRFLHGPLGFASLAFTGALFVRVSGKIVELFKGWKTAFPDAAGKVTSAVGSDNMAALEVTWTGTHTGPLETADGTIAASGKRQETPAAIVFTFEGGKIKEDRQYFDLMTLLKQIGALDK